jgi:hypothetical protein
MKRTSFEIFTFLFFTILALATVLPHLLVVKINPEDLPPLPRKSSDVVTQDTVLNSCPARRHTLRWADNSGRNFKFSFFICKSDAQKAIENRAKTGFVQYPTRYDYQQLVLHDLPFLKDIKEQLDTLATQNNLSTKEKLVMIVNMVQYIEYALVHPKSCATLRQELQERGDVNNFLYQWHFNIPPYEPTNGRRFNLCEENIEQYGVLSPLEMLYQLQGDCDSRTTLLYALLSEMGYKVAILNSDVLRHSILGVQTNEFNGTRYQEGWYGNSYLVWETTTTMSPGVFPNFKNSDWNIVLKN